MRISESKIAEVASAADIVATISDYVALKKAGKDYRGVCPFHGDKDPSFYVSPQKGIFHCFGCATGGNVFTFIMKMESVTFIEAVNLLAKKHGIPISPHYAEKNNNERDQIHSLLHSAQEFFGNGLKGNEAARQYLIDRDIDQEWHAKIGLGFAPDAWDAFTSFLRSKGVNPKLAVAAGLIKVRPSGGFYDAFRSRIMIPIRDLSDRIVAFGGRIVGPGEPKYLNSPESPVFHKKNILYGLDTAREAIKREQSAVLVEGYFDQISLRIRGIENVIATLGTALGIDQIRLLKRFTTNIVTVFDGDEAGIRAVKRSIPLFLSCGVEPRCLILTKDKDPDEAIRRVGKDNFLELINDSPSAVDYFLSVINRNHNVDTLEGRNSALDECIPVLREIADSKDRDYFIERFASALKIREDRIRQLVSRPNNQRISEKRVGTKSLFDFPADERNIIRGILLKEGFFQRVLESGTLKDIENPVLHRLSAEILTHYNNNGIFDAGTFCASLEDPELAAIAAGWMKPRPEEDDLRDNDGELTLEDSLQSLRTKRLHKRKSEIMDRMKHCVPGNDEFKSLARELQVIGKQLRK